MFFFRTDLPANGPGKKLPLTKSKTTANVNTTRHHSLSAFDSSSPPPLPPRKSSMSWISFEDTGHEIRQSPKRITTLPSSYTIESRPYSTISRLPDKRPNHKVILVNPDECSCECHENTSNRSLHH